MSKFSPDSDAPSDLQLVQSTLQGEREAFGTLVERYQDRLFNTLVRVLGSHEDAEDVLQETFIQAYAKLESFRGASQFYTWLYRVAMNLALSHRRKRHRTSETVSIEQAKQRVGDEPLDQQPGPQRTMMAEERAQLVQTALDRISDEHRQILVLRETEDCSYETIAEILELPVGTVRSRLFRARLQLKEQLQGMLPEDTIGERYTETKRED